MNSTTERSNFVRRPFDISDLMISPCLGGQTPTIPSIRTHFPRLFHLAVDFLGLRRSGSSPQIIDQAQDFPEQFPRHRDLGQLERDVPAMADYFRTDLDQLLPQRRQ